MDLIKVSANSRTSAVAGAIAGVVREQSKINGSANSVHGGRLSRNQFTPNAPP